jgi:F0F1-type ATP synthase beta subunit
MSSGSIRSIRDLVIVVQFDEDGPEIGELLVVNNPSKSVLMVNYLDTNNRAVCLNIFSHKDLTKNMAAERTGRGISIPVGSPTI